ncbi:MAG TPA: KpsF/GutQ family sugar-phosphate isomerase [Candidatus Kapabacteria bacterium]|nr:KpsF/GutQ family sugar-phosphate isomerase [Candidatus Kapabacteria bacterium]
MEPRLMLIREDLISEAIRVFEDEIEGLQIAKNKIDSSFADAVTLISSSHKVVLSGVGKSGLIARKIAATLSSIGCSATFLHPVEALHGDIGLVQKDDVAILLSKSGTTEELNKLIPYLKFRGAKIISILGNINSTIASYSDVVLDGTVEREACPFNLAPTTSSTLALVIGDALAIAVMKVRGTTLEDFSKLHPLGLIGRSITVKVSDIMHKGTNIPTIQQSAKLKDAIIEISRKNLGCVCVVNDAYILEGIITDGDIRRVFQHTENITDLRVFDIMTKDPIKISEGAYLQEAIALMENRNSEISVLPVVDINQQLLGVIRLHDIVRSGS